MTHEPSSPHSLVDEATNANTTPARLIELAKAQELQPYVAGNPNTPLQTLIRLAEDFPEEFLNNPVIPLLNLAQPDFFHTFTGRCWVSLLTCENVPKSWVDHAKSITRTTWAWSSSIEIYQLAAMHVASAGDVTGNWQRNAINAIYNRKFKYHYYSKDSDLPVSLFFLISRLFPQHVTGASKWWQDAFVSYSKDVRTLFFTYACIIPAKILARMSHELQDLELRCHILRHPAIPERILNHFMNFPDANVRGALAQNSKLSIEQITQLAGDKDAYVRRLAAKHPHLKQQHKILELLCYDEESRVRQAIASRPDLPKQLVLLLSNDPAPEVRVALAHQKNLAAAALAKFSKDSSEIVQIASASHPRLAETTMEAFAEHPNPAVRASLARNLRLPIELIERLVRDVDINIRAIIAAHPKLPLTQLQNMASIDEPAILTGIARNPNTPAEILTKLANSSYFAVQAAITTNKNTPPEALRNLFYLQQNIFVHGKALARHKNTPLDILTTLLASHDIELWCILMTHPTMQKLHHKPFYDLFDKEVIKLRKHLPSWFTIVLLDNQQTSPQQVEGQSQSRDWQERLMATKSEHISHTTLQRLTHDGNRYVRAAARQTLRKRRSQLDS